VISRATRAVLLLLAISWCPRAHADVPASAEAARGHFLAGKAYYGAGEYKRALAEFLAARADLDRPELDYNIGLVYEALGDAGRALTAFERFSSRYAAGDPALSEELRQRIAGLRPRVATLVLSSHGRATTLAVDGEPLLPAERGRPMLLSAGEHVLTASAEGAYTSTRNVTLIAGQTTTVILDAQERSAKRRFPGWAIALVSVGSALVIGGVVAGAVVGARSAETTPLVVGNAAPGVVNVKP